MKIDHLPIGARFVWKGLLYTKVGPMTAAADSGGSAFVPKHAVLLPAPGEASVELPHPAAGPLDAAKVIAAFERYHHEVVNLVDENRRESLLWARTRFLDEIR